MTVLVAGGSRRIVEGTAELTVAHAEGRTFEQNTRSSESGARVAAYLLAVALTGFILAVLALIAVLAWAG